MPDPPPAPAPARWDALLTALPVTGAAIVLLARAHCAVYVDRYPTLRQSVLLLCFVGRALGLGLALSALEHGTASRRAASIAATALVALALVEVPASA